MNIIGDHISNNGSNTNFSASKLDSTIRNILLIGGSSDGVVAFTCEGGFGMDIASSIDEVVRDLRDLANLSESKDSGLAPTTVDLADTLDKIAVKLNEKASAIAGEIVKYSEETTSNEMGATQSIGEIDTSLENINTMLDNI